VVTGLDYPDGLATTSAAAHNDAPILFVTPTSIPTATATELTRLHPSTITIVGGTSAVSPAIATQLAKFDLAATTELGDPLPRP
jgi:putative cell wall-binding protein